MIKNYLLKTLVIAAVLLFANESKAQLFSATGVSLNNYSGDSCTVFAATVNTYLGCINFTQGPVTKSLSGNTITIQVNYTSSPICAGAISQPVFNTNIRRVPPGTYNIVAEAYLDNNFVNSVNATATLTSVSCTATDIKENLDAKIDFFPNPAKGVLNFINIKEETKISILDLKGSTVLNKAIFNDDIINLEELPSGIYFLRLETVNSSSINKLVIQ